MINEKHSLKTFWSQWNGFLFFCYDLLNNCRSVKLMFLFAGSRSSYSRIVGQSSWFQINYWSCFLSTQFVFTSGLCIFDPIDTLLKFNSKRKFAITCITWISIAITVRQAINWMTFTFFFIFKLVETLSFIAFRSKRIETSTLGYTLWFLNLMQTPEFEYIQCWLLF